MLPIIHKNINNQEVNTVNARDLHKFLESGKDFSTWIKDRINQYGFIENQDFIKLTQKGELSKTGQTLIDYHLSLDMAKQLCMVERNPKGKDARIYFIECERKVKQAPTVPVLPFDITDPMSIMDWSKNQFMMYQQRESVKDAIIAEQSRVLTLQNETIETNKEFEAFVKQMQESKKSKNFTECSKILSDAFDFPMTAHNLKCFCILRGFLNLDGLPSQSYRKDKLFRVFVKYIESTGQIRTSVLITGNGLLFLSREVKPYKVFFSLKKDEYKDILEPIKNGINLRKEFMERLKNATHYSNTELLV
jgi:phage anti-repressor protein